VVEDVLLAAGVMVLLFVIVTAAVAAVLVRAGRRRYRSLQARLRAARAVRPEVDGLVRKPGSVALATVASPRWWAIQNRRHQLWQAVSSAEHAVGVARRADAAVGDLPALVARLHTAATQVDAVLRASARAGTMGTEDRLDCDRIIAAAADLRSAALASLRSGSHADTDTVVSAVQIEVAALAAGVRASHG
jgi:hypothetical protein